MNLVKLGKSFVRDFVREEKQIDLCDKFYAASTTSTVMAKFLTKLSV